MCEQYLPDVTMEKGLTMKHLFQACLEEMARGDGDRNILFSGIERSGLFSLFY